MMPTILWLYTYVIQNRKIIHTFKNSSNNCNLRKGNNFIIFNFGDKGIENISGGSDISFNKVMREQGKIYGLSGTQYGECLECSFQICKNPCIYNDYGIDNEEYREIMRWLNRREFLPFKPFNGETGGNEEIWFNGSFNINKLIMNGKTYGLELTLVTDKPFGYGKEF